MSWPQTLVLVRHGESTRNAAKEGDLYFPDSQTRDLVADVPDYLVPMTERGWSQARTTGIALKRLCGRFDLVIHSGYLRTIETAQAILEAYKHCSRTMVQSNLMIRERDPGFNFSLTKAEVEHFFPYHEDYWNLSGSFFSYPPGGEPIVKVCERVYVFLEMLRREHADQKILIVTHGGTIRAFRFWLENWDFRYVTENYDLEAADNCAVFSYEYNQGQTGMIPKIKNQIFW